jgi:acyl carrier protein
MSRAELLDKVKNIIQPYVGDQEAFNSLSEDSHLVNDLKINSAHVVDIVLDIESEFDIAIDDDSINNMTTIASSLDLIENQTK